MKQKTLILEEYRHARQTDLTRLLLLLASEEDTSVTIILRFFQTAPDRDGLLSFAEAVKTAGKEREFTVDVILETNQWKRVLRLKKTLNRFSIRVRLWVSKDVTPSELIKKQDRLLVDTLVLPCENFEQLQEAYQKWKQTGLMLDCKPYQLSSAAFREFLPVWLSDPDAVWLETLEDMTGSLLSGLSFSDCRYSSCLGKNFYLDSSGFVYFCREKRHTACLGKMERLPEEFLEADSYQNVLKQAVQRRKACKENCDIYAFCKGGCPLEEQTEHSCQELRRQLDTLGKLLQKEISSGFGDVENPCLRQLCLSLAAYGFQFGSF